MGDGLAAGDEGEVEDREGGVHRSALPRPRAGGDGPRSPPPWAGGGAGRFNYLAGSAAALDFSAVVRLRLLRAKRGAMISTMLRQLWLFRERAWATA